MTTHRGLGLGGRSQQPCYMRFTIQSSDVLQDTKINVLEENSQTVIWHKERFLGEDEIIEHIVHTPTNTICWSIHKPTRGWYIRLRSPHFPPGVNIPLIPVPKISPHYVEGALSFVTRTNVTTAATDRPSTSRHSSVTTIHSYPPTPPITITTEPPSPDSVHAKLDELSNRESFKRRTLPSTQPTRFVLSPTSYQVVQPASNSLFSRAWAAFQNHRPSQSNSFTLSRIPEANPVAPPPPYTSMSELPASIPLPAPTPLPTPPPMLLFHDRTPVLTAYSITGLLEIDSGQQEFLGVDMAFWIAVALAYLEFLEDRESYLAAITD